MRQEILRMERVTYMEADTPLLENFCITVMAGEILGLIPINSYGVDSFLHLAVHNLPLHYGYVYYREKIVNSWKNQGRDLNRISIIRNESCLVDKLTVADNIFVLRRGFKKRIINHGVLKKQLQLFLKDIDINISADAFVEDLTPFEKLIIELLRAIVAGNWLVILEGIGTIVSNKELQKIHFILRHYAEKGFAFIYIESHYEEMKSVCDRIALMENGHITKIFNMKDVIPDIIRTNTTKKFEQIIMKNLLENEKANKIDEVVFRAESVCCKSIQDLNLTIKKGECVVIHDLDNAIYTDLIKGLNGDEKISSGKFLVEGKQLDYGKSRDIAIIQELPIKTLLFKELSYLDNLCFTLDHRIKKVWGNKDLKSSLIKELTPLLGEEVFFKSIKNLTLEQQYDLIYTRILLQKPKIVFCVKPFKGAGVSLRMHIAELIHMLIEKGISVGILTVNLSDSLAVADRLICISQGKVEDEYDRTKFDKLPVSVPWQYLYNEKGHE
ncbi:MAG: sugar transporter ATP-binding protein [Anaerocolumna sp.]|jgi:ribose transport system ATP-binding protein|nr:sugar transporter ATP-binding protein [Anaerocolumna sp.]